jgi:hypothetical protein
MEQQKDTCAWCGAPNSLMVRTRYGKPVMACVDWKSCGEREKLRHSDPRFIHLQAPWDPKAIR